MTHEVQLNSLPPGTEFHLPLTISGSTTIINGRLIDSNDSECRVDIWRSANSHPNRTGWSPQTLVRLGPAPFPMKEKEEKPTTESLRPVDPKLICPACGKKCGTSSGLTMHRTKWCPALNKVESVEEILQED